MDWKTFWLSPFLKKNNKVKGGKKKKRVKTGGQGIPKDPRHTARKKNHRGQKLHWAPSPDKLVNLRGKGQKKEKRTGGLKNSKKHKKTCPRKSHLKRKVGWTDGETGKRK